MLYAYVYTCLISCQTYAYIYVYIYTDVRAHALLDGAVQSGSDSGRFRTDMVISGVDRGSWVLLRGTHECVFVVASKVLVI